MICLNNINLEQDYIFSQEIDNDENKSRITTSFLKFPKESEFGKNLIIQAKNIINNQKLIKWGIIGPWFLAEQVKKYNLENYSWDYKKTCQIPWPKAKDFIKNNAIYDDKQPFLHLFSEMWNTYNINKNYFYKKGIYGQLLKKHNMQDLIKELDYKFTFKDRYYFIFKVKYYIRHPKRIFKNNI